MPAGGPIFIVGSARSGTTLLRDLLRSHPSLTFPGESHVVPLLYRAYGDPADAREARRLARALLTTRWIRGWGLQTRPEELEHHRTNAGLVADLYAEFAGVHGKARWGDKTPQYALEIPTLMAMFPDAQVIHVVRDGRDVALSLRSRAWAHKTAYVAARSWRHVVATARAAGQALPARAYREVRYEELVTEPGRVLEALCVFLGEPFDQAVLTRTRFKAGAGDRPAPGLEDAIVSSRAERWRTEMSSDDQAVFEAEAGDLLEHLGYPTLGVARPIGRAERAWWGARDRARVHWGIARRTRVADVRIRLAATLAARRRARRGGRAQARC